MKMRMGTLAPVSERVYAKAPSGQQEPAVTIDPMRLIAPSQYRRMPWKNGGGTTLEVALHPSGAGWDSFVWRVSIAQIASSGPFSTLAGVDRTLVVLAGGMALTGVLADAIEVRPYDCVAFAGEAKVASRLLDGPTRDFNVMTRRGAATAEVRVAKGERVATAGAATYVCHAASQPCTCVVDDATIEVPPSHTLVADARRLVVDASPDAVAVVAMVSR
jgi:environmental stress-induced protein Ves